MLYFGVAAALCTACFWAGSSVIHANVARKVGVHSLLLLRQPMCVAFLAAAAFLAGEFSWYPPYWVMMGALSGVLAIFFHDWLFYESITRAGVRCAVVCNSLSAVCTAVLGVFFLSEDLGVLGMGGILVSTAGVMLVVGAEQGGSGSALRNKALSPRDYAIGVAMALATALLSAVGMILSKAALSNGIPPLFMALLRNIVALVGFVGAGFLLHSFRSTLQKAKATPHIFWMLVAGCVLGPGGGTWLFMVAIQNCGAAVTATLVGLEPVALLVITGLWERRCPSRGSIIGSVTACTGAALLFWR